jgi:hypothetical protein
MAAKKNVTVSIGPRHTRQTGTDTRDRRKVALATEHADPRRDAEQRRAKPSAPTRRR